MHYDYLTNSRLFNPVSPKMLNSSLNTFKCNYALKDKFKK